MNEEQHPQQAFLPFQIPWMGAPHTDYRPSSPNEEPARIKLALQYLNSLVIKVIKRAAVNDISIEIIDGPGLEQCEKKAQEAACAMLTNYFSGKLAPNEHETCWIGANEPRAGSEHGPGMVIHCIACRNTDDGRVKPDCVLCRGSGSMICYPANSGKG